MFGDMMGMMGKLKETQQKVEATKKRLDTVTLEEKSNDNLISVKSKKISKKWFRTHSTKPNQSELQKELSAIPLKDNYYFFTSP